MPIMRSFYKCRVRCWKVSGNQWRHYEVVNHCLVHWFANCVPWTRSFLRVPRNFVVPFMS